MARRSAAASKKNTRSLRVDFTGVTTRFNPPEGDYAVEIEKVEKTESQAGNDQLQVTVGILSGKYEGKSFPLWFSLVDEALWKLSGFLSAAGVEIPDEAIDLDFDDIEGRKLEVSIEHREYNGNKKYDVSSAAPYEDDDEDEKPKGKKTSSKDDDEEDEPKGRKRRPSKEEDDEDEPKSRKRRAAKDDDEDEKPKGKKGKKLVKLSEEAISDMDEDELGDVVEKYDLEVDLDDLKTLRKKAAAVIDAMTEADMIDED